MHTARKEGERYQERGGELVSGRLGDGASGREGNGATALAPVPTRPLAPSALPPAIIRAHLAQRIGEVQCPPLRHIK